MSYVLAMLAAVAPAQLTPGAPADQPVAQVPAPAVARSASNRQGDVAPAGDVLWDQPTDGGGAFVDQTFPDFPDFDTYLVCDVVVDEPGWNVTGVTMFFTDPGTWPMGDNPATLNIFEKTGTLPEPGDDPAAGMQVTAQIEPDVFGLAITAAGLDINLAPGEYWIGLTPDVNFGQFGQAFHLETFFPQGDGTAARNPGGAFAIGSDWIDAGTAFGGVPGWDGAIRVNGTEGAGVCIADCNGDGVLNILDFVCFQTEWQNQTALGDCDGNGLYNILDFVCFQGEFQQGCP